MTGPAGDGLERVNAEVARILAGKESLPPSKQLPYLRDAVANLPPELRAAVEPLVLATHNLVIREPSRVASTGERAAAAACVAFGVVLLVLLYSTGALVQHDQWMVVASGVTLLTLWLVSIVNPVANAQKEAVSEVMMAVAAAGAAASLPGLLEIEFDTEGKIIRASGALAVFVMVLFRQGILSWISRPSGGQSDEAQP